MAGGLREGSQVTDLNPPFERSSKRRKGFPSETQVRRGDRVVQRLRAQISSAVVLKLEPMTGNVTNRGAAMREHAGNATDRERDGGCLEIAPLYVGSTE